MSNISGMKIEKMIQRRKERNESYDVMPTNTGIFKKIKTPKCRRTVPLFESR